MAKKVLTDEEKKFFHDMDLYVRRWDGLKKRYKNTDISHVRKRDAIMEEIYSRMIVPVEATWINFGIKNGSLSRDKKDEKKIE